MGYCTWPFVTIADIILSKHSVIWIKTGDIHLKFLYFIVMFIPAIFPQGRLFLFPIEWLCVFLPSSICAPRCFCHIDVVALGTLDLISHTLSLVYSPFPFVLYTRQSSLSHCRGLNATPAVFPCRTRHYV